MKTKLIFTFLIGILFITHINSQEVIYETNEDGESLSGSIDELIKYVNKGYTIRVGWQIKGLDENNKETIITHWTDAGFITVYKNHVFAQVNSIFEQGVSLGKKPSVFLAKGNANGWVAIVGTNGQLKQKFNNDHIKKLPDEILKEMENMVVKTKWVVIKNH